MMYETQIHGRPVIIDYSVYDNEVLFDECMIYAAVKGSGFFHSPGEEITDDVVAEMSEAELDQLREDLVADFLAEQTEAVMMRREDF